MNSQVLINNSDYKNALIPLLKKASLTYNFVGNIEDLYTNCLANIPKMIIIQDNIGTKLQMIDLIRDLRMLFGTAPSFIMVGDDRYGDEIAHYLGQGLDNFFGFPFDTGLLEDFFFKSTKKDLCLPFKFRNVPSGGMPISIEFNINLTEVNSNGILFESEDLLTKGLIFETELDNLIGVDHCLVKLKVLQNSRNEDGIYENFAEFYELSNDLRKKIIHNLKFS